MDLDLLGSVFIGSSEATPRREMQHCMQTHKVKPTEASPAHILSKGDRPVGCLEFISPTLDQHHAAMSRRTNYLHFKAYPGIPHTFHHCDGGCGSTVGLCSPTARAPIASAFPWCASLSCVDRQACMCHHQYSDPTHVALFGIPRVCNPIHMTIRGWVGSTAATREYFRGDGRVGRPQSHQYHARCIVESSVASAVCWDMMDLCECMSHDIMNSFSHHCPSRATPRSCLASLASGSATLPRWAYPHPVNIRSPGLVAVLRLG